MNLEKLFLKEIQNTIKSTKNISLNEDVSLSNKTLINVDIQPEYKNYISFNLREWVKFINKSSENNTIIFLYNGYDTLGMITENDYIEWLIELGIDEDVINNSTFYDKGYAFFRYCIDNSIDEDRIVDLIKFMIYKDVNDSRDLKDKELWDEFVENYGYEDLRDLMEFSGDCINIPDLMDFLKNTNNIVLMGGGINECLKEVEIALKVLDKPYNTINKFTY